MFVPTPAGINSLLVAAFVGLDGNAMTGADALSQWQVDVATFPHVMLAVRVPLPLGMLMVRNANHDTGTLAVCSAIVLGVA